MLPELKTHIGDTNLELVLKTASLQYRYMYVPTSTIYTVRKLTNTKLKTVYKDPAIAREILFLILTFFSKSYSRMEKADKGSRESLGYIRLYSQLLDKQLRVKGVCTYAKALKLLVSEGIIEMGKDYSTKSNRAREYRLTKRFFNLKITRMLPTQEISKKFLTNLALKEVANIVNNPIAIEAIKVREAVTFPTTEEMKSLLIKEAKKGFVNKRGMKLVYLNKRRKGDFKDCVFVEDYLIDYENARDNFLLPIVSGEDSGGRVYTAFNTMARVMRKHLKINGEAIVEVDYSTLHPNIISTLFGDSKEQITHDIVAEYLGISREEAKKEHLSFFNLKVLRDSNNKKNKIMKDSVLYNYYMDKAPEMMYRVINDKLSNGYKNTSKLLFQTEVALMTEVTKELIKKGINSIYVFDCCYVQASKLEEVKEIMNKAAELFNINTTV